MAHFYASIQGNRGKATRLGSKTSGIFGHVSGWNIGCKVYVNHNTDGQDVVTVYRTGGSNGGRPEELIATFTERTKP